MARNLSASLNDAFAMDNHLEGLAQSVELKYFSDSSSDNLRLIASRKQAVSSQNAELEALEAKLRATEERLKEQRSRNSSPAGRAAGATNSPRRRQPLGETTYGQGNERSQQSSGTSSLTAQAPAPGSVSASTMAHWRPAAQDHSPRGSARDLSAEQFSGQQGSRYTQ